MVRAEDEKFLKEVTVVCLKKDKHSEDGIGGSESVLDDVF